MNREVIKPNIKAAANPFNLFKGKEKRREHIGGLLDPLSLTKAPDIPEPPPPPTAAADPAIEEAKNRQRRSELLRRGRRSAILTSSRGVGDELGTVNRPSAEGSNVLG